MARLVKIFCVFFFSSLFCLAQNNTRPLTLKDQIEFDIPTKAVISPKGDKILFLMRKADLKLNRWNTQVFIMDRKTGSYYQFSADGENCSAPAFSPDQQYATFVSARKYWNPETMSMESGAAQLWCASLNGGEAHNITWLKNSVGEYTWSDDGKAIALLTEADSDTNNPEKYTSKLDEQVYPLNSPVKMLSLLNFADKKITNTFPLDAGVEAISFNHAGDKIVYQTNLTGEYNDEQKFDVYIIDTTGKKTQITSAAGPETAPLFSPSGKRLAYITQTVPDIEFAKQELCIANEDGTNVQNITKSFPYSIESFKWEDENTIVAVFNKETSSPVYSININTGKLQNISSDYESANTLSFSGDKVLCYIVEDSVSLPEIVVGGKRVSSFSGALSKFAAGSQKTVSYKSKDGKFNITGVLFLPDSFSAQKKYPMILSIHGGPFGNFKNTFRQNLQIRALTGAGYVVFSSNPRGSSGGTDEFSQAARYDLGGNDYQDIMTGVDYIISLGFVDENRMGVTGGSYGGYMTDWIVSQNNRFKAAVSMFGIFNFITDWSNSFQPAFENMYFGYNYWEKPIDKNNFYINRSPAFYASNIKTPVLILQGDKDVYTDISNSREMYQALRALNIPVQFVVYPREGHGINKEPAHYINAIERMVDWFGKYIK